MWESGYLIQIHLSRCNGFPWTLSHITANKASVICKKANENQRKTCCFSDGRYEPSKTCLTWRATWELGSAAKYRVTSCPSTVIVIFSLLSLWVLFDIPHGSFLKENTDCLCIHWQSVFFGIFNLIVLRKIIAYSVVPDISDDPHRKFSRQT